jgi:hypothetical protein
LAGGEFVPGKIDMGNGYPASGHQKHRFGPLSANNDVDEGSDSDVSAALASLIEENVRLRALVVQLSDLVLKNVVAPK